MYVYCSVLHAYSFSFFLISHYFSSMYMYSTDTSQRTGVCYTRISMIAVVCIPNRMQYFFAASHADLKVKRNLKRMSFLLSRRALESGTGSGGGVSAQGAQMH